MLCVAREKRGGRRGGKLSRRLDGHDAVYRSKSASVESRQASSFSILTFPGIEDVSGRAD